MPQRPGTPDLPEIGLEQAARFRLRRQHLLAPASGDLAVLVAQTGWLHAASSATPYLALFARCENFHRESLDRVLFEERSLLELPGARATTFVVPADEGMFCLFGYARDVESRIQKLRQPARLTDAELEKIENAVRSALAQGPLLLEEIRAKLPDELNRDLGPAGQSTGYRNLLAAALARLLARGVVLKVSDENRLDRGRTVFTTAKKVVSDKRLRPVGPAETARKLAQIYFAAAGPASVGDFSWWAGLSAEEARAAVTALDGELAAVRMAGERVPLHLPAEALDDLRASGGDAAEGERGADDAAAGGTGAEPPSAILLPHGDNLFALRRATVHTVSPEHARFPIVDWRGGATPAGVAGAAHHAPVVVNGLIAGAWEYDPASAKVRWETFEPQPDAVAEALESQAGTLAAFIHDELDPAAGRGDETLSRPGKVREMARLWRSLRRGSSR
jgi:uncharacterized protein YcaQ